ncbi:MAG: hypothetical protein FJY17_02855 [Bacteroidetes bacterium]|nr:hypothetical protein [Bacteroidota bacterium]MBM3417846.1 hypothetical protein [Bacteroidota bacterium]
MEVHNPKFVRRFIEEILVVVIGISLAVTAERIVQTFQQQKEEKGVISRMTQELRRDSIDLAYNLKHHQLALVADSLLSRWSKGEIELAPDSLKIYTSRSLIFTFFASSTTEIEALKGAGKLYLIEDPELLSNILKHYNRYADFKISTDLGMQMSQQIIELYKANSTLKTNIVSIQNQSKVYEFDPQELEKNLRGNRGYENLLQEKRVYDAFVVGQARQAITRLNAITAALAENQKPA